MSKSGFKNPVKIPRLGLTQLRSPSNFFFVFCFFWFFETGFLCSFGACPGTPFVDQAGLKLTEIGLLLPPKCWDYRRAPPPPGSKQFLKIFLNYKDRSFQGEVDGTTHPASSCFGTYCMDQAGLEPTDTHPTSASPKCWD